jgi:DNA-binding response OmpR family regulator
MRSASAEVFLGSEPIEVTDLEYAVLQFLLRHQGEIFSAEELLDHVWRSESDATSSAVASCMKRLRRKLSPEGGDSLIKTSYGKGYKLEP